MTVTAAPTTQARRARTAVAILFGVNGALFANVVPRYPDLKASLGLSNSQLGTAVAAYGLGALVCGLLAGVLVSRWGSVRVAPACAVGIALNLLLVAVAPSWAVLCAVLFVAGSLDSIADVANNTHGLRVERRYGRSILVSMHGLWSIGAVIGGAMGSVAAGLGLPLPLHFGVAAAVFGAVAVVASRFLLPGPDDGSAPDGVPGADGFPVPDGVPVPDGTHGTSAGRHRRRRRRIPLHLAGALGALGIVAASGQIMEDAGATWSPVYLRDDLGAAAAVGGLAFIALQACQTLGRLVGDRVVTRFGDRTVARGGAVLAAGAMSLALAFPSVPGTIAAFGVVGLGIGTLIPAGMRAADALPGLPPGVGLSLAGTVLRIAVFAVPPIVGVVADATSLRLALLVVPVAAAAVLLLARTLPTRRPP